MWFTYFLLKNIFTARGNVVIPFLVFDLCRLEKYPQLYPDYLSPLLSEFNFWRVFCIQHESSWRYNFWYLHMFLFIIIFLVQVNQWKSRRILPEQPSGAMIKNKRFLFEYTAGFQVFQPIDAMIDCCKKFLIRFSSGEYCITGGNLFGCIDKWSRPYEIYPTFTFSYPYDIIAFYKHLTR